MPNTQYKVAQFTFIVICYETQFFRLLESLAQRIVTLKNSHQLHEQKNQREESKNTRFSKVRQFAYVLGAEREKRSY